MEEVNAEELARFLDQHLESDLVERLKDQKIKGKDFLSLTHSTLKLFGFTLGDVLAISSLQEKLNSGQLKYTTSVGDSVFSNSEGNSLSRKPTTDCHNKENARDDLSSWDAVSDDDAEEIGDDAGMSDSDLLEWMSQEDLDQRSSYEKLGLKNKLRNFKLMKEKGVTSSVVPSGFMIFEKTRNKESDRNLGTASTNQNQKSARSASTNKNQKSTGRALVQTRSSARLKAASRVQLVNPIEESSDEEVESDKENTPTDMYKPDAAHLKRTRQELQEIKPHLGEIDVVTIVKEHRQTKGLQIQALAVMWPGRSERDQIIDGMTKTFQYRQNLRKKGVSITEMIKEFPQFHNYNGELITNEFGLMFPKAKDMCSLFLKHVPKILEKWPTIMGQLLSVDTTAQACYTLACKLPHVPHLSVEVEEDTDDSTTVLHVGKELIVIRSPKDDITDYAERRREHQAGPVQPYLIGVKSDLTSEVMKYFLVLDGRPMELGKIHTIRGIDWVFKACCVFNVFFPPSWTNFFRLLQTCYYEVFFTNEDDAPASAIEHFKILQEI